MTGLRKRQNVFNLGGAWADPILWYAKGVKAMKARKLREPTSWNFYAAIHGLDGFRPVWDFYGFTDPADANPSQSDLDAYADQCQHQSWYFLPWHRGYLLALETMIRHEIKLLDGPHETWALPYWNYFEPGQNILPPAFASQTWPGGADVNPLYVERFGQMVTQAPFDITPWTNLNSMGDPNYFGPGGGASAGFGGPLTAFNLGSGTNGAVESAPHNAIHTLVGGAHPTVQIGNPPQALPGIMSDPRTAALDPIFYLHHCNVDRLWEAWNKFPAGKPTTKPTDWKNPTHPLWQQGPTNVGQRAFSMPQPGGGRWDYTPKEMEDIVTLGYEYDTLQPGATVPSNIIANRMVALGLAVQPTVDAGALQMRTQPSVEMIGTNGETVHVEGSETLRAQVRTAPELRSKVIDSFSAAPSGDVLPDRVFVSLENVTSASDAVMLQVYVGPSAGAPPSEHQENLAGSVALFGVSQASDPNGPHAGNGITYTLEITEIVDRLHSRGRFDVETLQVDLVPLGSVSPSANVNIGRISIFRQYE